MAMLLGKKISMTRFVDEAGCLVGVTVVQAGPCVVTQIKTEQTDGYRAIQMGFDNVKPAQWKQPALGHGKHAGTSPKRFIREWRLTNDEESKYKVGDTLTVVVFNEKDRVDVIGISKGKGFAGGMKRYGFGGFPASHGTERKHRAPGSLAGHATDRGHGGQIKKGKRMAGHMGAARATLKNLVILAVDPTNDLLVLKGSVPGAVGSYCMIRSAR